MYTSLLPLCQQAGNSGADPISCLNDSETQERRNQKNVTEVHAAASSRRLGTRLGNLSVFIIDPHLGIS